MTGVCVSLETQSFSVRIFGCLGLSICTKSISKNHGPHGAGTRPVPYEQQMQHQIRTSKSLEKNEGKLLMKHTSHF